LREGKTGVNMPGIITWENGNLNFSGNSQENWVIPTKGQKGKKCGEPDAVLSCQVCLKPHFIIHKCMYAGCPDCGMEWIKKSSIAITLKLKNPILKRRNHIFPEIKHIVISPSSKLHHLPKIILQQKAEQYLEEKSFVYLFPRGHRDLLLEKKLIKIGGKYTKRGTLAIPYSIWKNLGGNNGLKQKVRRRYTIKWVGRGTGVLGGVLIFHPFRLKEEAKERALEEGKKYWEWVREQKDWKKWVYYSPHFHFIGYCGWLEDPKEGEDFVYKTIEKEGEEGEIAILRDSDIYRCVFYLLTHAGISHFKHAYDWIGNARGILKSWEEELIKKFRFSIVNGKIVFHISKEDLKKKENYCRFCLKEFGVKRNSLFYFQENLKHALWHWLGITWNDYLENKAKVLEILKAKETSLPWYIYRNLEENILAMLGIPPNNWKEFLITFEF